MASVTVSRSGDRLIAIKQVGAARGAELEREAELLRRVDHPGVVRFIDLTETPDGDRALHTEFVSSETWATRPLTDPAERAAGMAALAAVVADLHDLGLAHLHITPGHVLHGEDDRPVLCGLTRADEATPEHRYADLVALAALCCDESMAKGPLAAKLSSLADAARAGRLSARELARKLDQLLAKRAPGPQTGPRRGIGALDRLRHAPRGARYSAAAVLLAVAGALAVVGWRDRAPDAVEAGGPLPVDGRSDQVEAGGPVPVGGRSDQVETLSPAAAGSADPTGTMVSLEIGEQAPETGPPQSQADLRDAAPSSEDNQLQVDQPASDRAPTEPVAPGASALDPAGAAAVLEHGGRRYAIGLQGDLVATGDWDCDGTPTPAIVRPATGDVVLFEGWPGHGETLSMPVRWTVQTPTGVEVLHDESCDLLRVLTPSGSQLLDPRRMQ